MKRFEGKVALVTGAAQGIGRGVALCLAREGADVVVSDLAPTEISQQVADEVRELGQQAVALQVDVSDRAAMTQMFAEIVSHFGHLDIAVANAAITVRQPVIEADWEGVRRTIEVSQFGVFHTCQMAAQQMVRQGKGGKIVMIGSVHQELAIKNSAAYNMAKAAINHLTRTMAAELAHDHINVNVINPGWIDTPGERRFSNEEAIKAGGKRIPWGRLGTIEDIGKAAAFLASDDADYITGAALRVDGGFVLGLQLPESQES